MNATVTTYAFYLVIALPLTVWVARNLFRNGRPGTVVWDAQPLLGKQAAFVGSELAQLERRIKAGGQAIVRIVYFLPKHLRKPPIFSYYCAAFGPFSAWNPEIQRKARIYVRL